MVMGKQEQMEGLWGDVPFGALEGRSNSCMDQCDQRRGVHHSIQFLKNHRLQRCKLILKETFGHRQPLLALVLMGALVLGLRLGGEMLVVPSQPQCISDLLRYKVKKCDMPGFGLFKRDEDSVKMGAHGGKQLQQRRILDLFDQAEQEQQLGADAGDRPEPTEGGTHGQGVAEQMAQEIPLIVAC